MNLSYSILDRDIREGSGFESQDMVAWIPGDDSIISNLSTSITGMSYQFYE
jgi:hypothetical protein